MATIAIACPKCEKQIKAPAELAGKKIRCKECAHIFIVKAPAAAPAGKGDKSGKGSQDKPDKKAAKAKAAAAEDDEDANPYAVTDQDFLPRCAYCAKEMEEEQIICLNCGYNHRTRERIGTAKTLEPTGGEWFIHLLPGIIFALVVLILIGLAVVVWIVFPRIAAENDSEWWSVLFGLAARIWSTVISLFICFFCGKFAIKRLILHRRPPERAMKTKKKD